MNKVKYLLVFLIVFLVGVGNAYAYSERTDDTYNGIRDNEIQMLNLKIKDADFKTDYSFERKDNYSDYGENSNGDLMVVYTGGVPPFEGEKYYGSFQLKWEKGAYDRNGVWLDVIMEFDVWFENEQKNPDWTGSGWTNKKPLKILSTVNNALWFNAGGSINDNNAKKKDDQLFFRRYGARYKVHVEFKPHNSNQEFNGDTKIAFHFRDLDQGDKRKYKYKYFYEDSSAIYTEGILFSNDANESGINGDLVFKQNSLLRKHNNSPSGFVRYTGTKETSDAAQDLAGFYTTFRASSFEFTWIGSDCGTRMGFIKETTFGNNDYSIDAACLGCGDEEKDASDNEQKKDKSKAFIIQDTTDWKAIMSSDRVNTCQDANSNIGPYYKKTDDGTYCREENHAYYPNKTTRLKAHVGRFFTLNAFQNELDIIDSSVPNYYPLKITKIRECAGGNLNSLKNNTSFLNEFSRCGGTVTVGYNDRSTDSNNYVYTGTLKSTLNGSPKVNIAYNNLAKENVLRMEADFLYTLKDNVFRYIRISDGLSIVGATQSDINKGIYTDVKVSNLPVKIEATKDPKIRFAYDLPNKSSECIDSKSNMYLALTEDNDYLKCSTSKYNVYDGNPNYTGGEDINNTACAKFWNAGTDRYKRCVNARKSGNKLGNCFKTIAEEYTCNIEIESDACTKNTAGKGDFQDYTWIDNRCCRKKDVVNGKCEDDVCTSQNYASLGRDFNWNTYKCCEKGAIYDPNTKRCNPGTNLCDSSHLDCAQAGRPCCVDENGKYYCGFYDRGETVCPGPGNHPTNVVYRVISTDNPFIAQTGLPRNTGNNWCSNSAIGSIHFGCGSDNQVVKTVITDKTLSEENAMYIIELDSNAINEIRSYNRNMNSYDLPDLSCQKDGSACESKFLRDTISKYVKTESKCQNVSVANFYKC